MVSFIVGHGDKIAFVGDNENAHTALFKILAGEMEPDEGTVKWGQTATFSYFPKDNTPYFQDNDDNLVQWLRQYSSDPQEQYLRGFLGRMLFSGDEVYKPVKVLSGGEKVRCMLSRMMLSGANVLMLDQPTNHLDLESIAALNKGLEAVKCNVLVASHDTSSSRPCVTGSLIHSGGKTHRPDDDLRRVSGEPEGGVIRLRHPPFVGTHSPSCGRGSFFLL